MKKCKIFLKLSTGNISYFVNFFSKKVDNLLL